MFGSLCSFSSPVGLGLHLLSWTVLCLGLVLDLTNYSRSKLLVKLMILPLRMKLIIQRASR